MTVVEETYGSKFDFPPHIGEVRTSYMLAASPRSGSTHFAMELWRTGVLGAPMEYPNLPFQSSLISRLAASKPEEYWEEVMRVRTSPNGVFGFKMFLTTYTLLKKRAPALLPLLNCDKVIYLTRSDVISQAVSYYKALNSGNWFFDSNDPRRVEYSFDSVRSCYESILHQNRQWEKLFRLTKAEVFRLNFDSFLEDPEKTIITIKDFLGVSLRGTSSDLKLPHMQRQGDAKSREFVERFKNDMRESSAIVPDLGQ